MGNSCVDCPSYLKADEVQSMFKKGTGHPMCAKFGHAIGRPSAKPVQINSIAEAFGSSCDSFGQARPVDPPLKPEMMVSMGDLSVQRGEPDKDERVNTCHECKHFVEPQAVRDGWGWTFPLCAATGRLLFPHRVAQEAKSCDWRSFGPTRKNLGDLKMAPMYEDAFDLDDDPIAVFLRARKKGAMYLEPTTRTTDKPVDSDWAKQGVRAWEKVTSPDGSGRHTYLPIYDPEFFPADERAKIPQSGDDEHPELYVDFSGAVYKIMVLWRELDETPMLWGMAGVGKTEIYRHLAWRMQLPFNRISLTAKSEVDDIIGSMRARATPTGSETYFHYGRLPLAWQRPGVTVLDEPNTAPDEIWQTIRPITDNSKQLVLDQNKAERLDRNISQFLGMACNPAWDPRNVGANETADADGNRLMHMYMTLPPEAVERAILEDRCMLDGYDPNGEKHQTVAGELTTLDLVMRIASEIRMQSDPSVGTLPISWGIRPQIKVLRATKWFDLLTSYRLAVADLLEPEQAKVVLDIIRANVPTLAITGHGADA